MAMNPTIQTTNKDRRLYIWFAALMPLIVLAGFALGAALYEEWRVGLVMVGVVPISILITVWQVTSQKGIRSALLHAKEGLDGTMVELSPERAIRIQEQLGADCIMCLDECPPYDIPLDRLEVAVDRTTRSPGGPHCATTTPH